MLPEPIFPLEITALAVMSQSIFPSPERGSSAARFRRESVSAWASSEYLSAASRLALPSSEREPMAVATSAVMFPPGAPQEPVASSLVSPMTARSSPAFAPSGTKASMTSAAELPEVVTDSRSTSTERSSDARRLPSAARLTARWSPTAIATRADARSALPSTDSSSITAAIGRRENCGANAIRSGSHMALPGDTDSRADAPLSCPPRSCSPWRGTAVGSMPIFVSGSSISRWLTRSSLLLSEAVSARLRSEKPERSSNPRRLTSTAKSSLRTRGATMSARSPLTPIWFLSNPGLGGSESTS